VPPEAWLVRGIAGDRVDVRILLRPGATPHTYEPSMADARAADGAGLYLAVGHPRLGFETAWRAALARGDGAGPRVVQLAAGCETEPDDPHVWLSPPCFRRMARAAEGALEALLPAGDAPALRRGADSVVAAVDRASAGADSLLAPYGGRAFLVYHPAWGYLAREHGLEQVSVQSGSREPGPAELARVFHRVREEGLHVMLVQPETPRSETSRIAGQLGLETVVLDPLARDWPSLYLDAARALARSWRP